MKTSVLIAAYNASKTIRSTLDSVLRQTVPPFEILIVNDGSTDDTASILESYKPRITVFEQENKGLSSARNVLCKRSQGDLLAFLDADDIWHPRYIETQQKLFEDNPNAIAFFTGHVNLYGNDTYYWERDPFEAGCRIELMQPLDFVVRYYTNTGYFACPSYCCITNRVLDEIGREPFEAGVRVCDDAYLFYLLALLGPVGYASAPLVAYRFTDGSLSSDFLRNHLWGVHVFKLLEDRYTKSAHPSLLRAFQMAFATKRRQYAKVLMGAGELSEAREQLRQSLHNTATPLSVAKSVALLCSTYMPAQLQPSWPARYRSQAG
jgi:glycosyltransferase involved in cell wall biosynthesis